MIWTKTSVSNTGPLFFRPPKKSPQNQPNRALQDELLSAGMPEAEVQPGDPTEKSGRVAVFGGDQNGKQLCQPELGANKAPCRFFLPI